MTPKSSSSEVRGRPGQDRASAGSQGLFTIPQQEFDEKATRFTRPCKGISSMGQAQRAREYLLLADEELISLVHTNQDPHAFATLYDRHSRAAFSLAYRMMGDHQAAEDILQESFLKLWRSASSYRAERASLRTWLLSIVHNRAIDQLRSRATKRRTQQKIEAVAPRYEASEAFGHTLANFQREQVREALRSLPEEQLKTLELAYFSGYTHVEIAELLGVPLGTVKGRMRLGLKKVRDYFDSRDMVVPR